MIVPIVKIGDPNADVLRCVTQEVVNPEVIQALVKNLFDTLDGNGVGLSAPQIGHALRIFVVLYLGWKQAFVNPHIFRVSQNKTSALEGCLSLPGVEVRVTRPKMVWLDFWDEKGVSFKNKKFRGMEARILQHEYEHLFGKLITDYK